ncbi:hypothetical protein [Streptomyces sp. DSM 40907]|uniref:hypothetical protein n=1 Tax=Streptomyces kutzneri TaxID=3051179 RepID=UPI0028D3AD54|nr:hypothetical protein [Streptomyces sp. DSM 40907]
MSYTTPEQIDQALGTLSDHCVVPRNSGERDAVFHAFGTIARASRELREAIALETGAS